MGNFKKVEVDTTRYLPETLKIIEMLIRNPTQRLVCAHGDDSAVVGLYEVPGGCVALPGVETQPLCDHHRLSDGSFEGMIPIIDLSIDMWWGNRIGEKPDFYVTKTSEGMEVKAFNQ
jgi:hypothetical protein